MGNRAEVPDRETESNILAEREGALVEFGSGVDF